MTKDQLCNELNALARKHEDTSRILALRKEDAALSAWSKAFAREIRRIVRRARREK